MNKTEKLRRESALLFTAYSSGKITRHVLAAWAFALDGYSPAAMDLVTEAQQWFSRGSFRKPEQVVLQDLELLLRLSEVDR
ncbi:hypothetical protein [Metarhizobium album]|nr:hypothetical protein [Rhizobium album]